MSIHDHFSKTEVKSHVLVDMLASESEQGNQVFQRLFTEAGTVVGYFTTGKPLFNDQAYVYLGCLR